MKQKIRILIADDHLIVRTGIAAILGTEKDLEVVLHGSAPPSSQILRYDALEGVWLRP